jgi:hypothetical protein
MVCEPICHTHTQASGDRIKAELPRLTACRRRSKPSPSDTAPASDVRQARAVLYKTTNFPHARSASAML